MTRQAGAPVPDALLRPAVRAGVARRHEPRCCVSIDRSPSDYATSYPIENITATLDDGSRLPLILKDLDPSRLSPAVRRAKPDFLVDPQREVAVYRSILMPGAAGAPVYAIGDDDRAPWLLLGKADGVELYQIGDIGAWIAAAAWLAGFHDAQRRAAGGAAPLIRHSAGFYWLWLDRARRFFRDAPPSPSGREGLARIAGLFDRVVDRALAWPATVIHGEYYASNVLAHRSASGWQVCPVDWEMAAIGPGVIDLAALTSGDWSEPERRRIVAGYVEASGPGAPALAETLDAVDCAQIILGVQWLGWFGRRRAPAGHARDWLGDALTRAGRLAPLLRN